MSENEENYYECLYCGATFDTEEERDAHTFEKHMDAVQEKLNEISEIAKEHKETLESWRQKKRIQLLEEMVRARPQILHEIQTSPHSEEMLDKMVDEALFKEALRTDTLSSFDAMWLRHPKFEEVYRAERSKPEHQPQTGKSTGQTEEYLPIDSPNAEAKKVLEKEQPINRVSFRSGKLILEPLSKDSIETLSDKDKSLMVFYALLRNKKKKSN